MLYVSALQRHFVGRSDVVSRDIGDLSRSLSA
jgi:hypothetical protein